MVEYILRRNTPKSGAGEVAHYKERSNKDESNNGYYITESGEIFDVKTVQSNPDWFKSKNKKEYKVLGQAIKMLSEFYDKDLGWYSIMIENHSEDSFSVHVQKVTY